MKQVKITVNWKSEQYELKQRVGLFRWKVLRRSYTLVKDRTFTELLKIQREQHRLVDYKIIETGKYDKNVYVLLPTVVFHGKEYSIQFDFLKWYLVINL